MDLTHPRCKNRNILEFYFVQYIPSLRAIHGTIENDEEDVVLADATIESTEWGSPKDQEYLRCMKCHREIPLEEGMASDFLDLLDAEDRMKEAAEHNQEIG